MERIVQRGILFDFYGELLTEHQRDIYSEAINDDLSLSEIADSHGISRQAAFDIMKRCDKLLNSYEDRLHLIERFSRILGTVEDIEKITNQEEVRRLANSILDEI